MPLPTQCALALLSFKYSGIDKLSIKLFRSVFGRMSFLALIYARCGAALWLGYLRYMESTVPWLYCISSLNK